MVELDWSSSLARGHDIRAFHCRSAFFCLVYYPVGVDTVENNFWGLDVVVTLDSDKNMARVLDKFVNKGIVFRVTG